MSEKVRRALMQAGLDVILERGYDKTTVADVVRRADYGRSTFYLYFANKEALAWAIMKHETEVFDARVRVRVDGMTSPERDWQAYVMMFEEVDRLRPLYLALDGKHAHNLRAIQKRYLIELFTGHYASGRTTMPIDVPPAIAARLVVGPLLELLYHHLYTPIDEGALQLFRFVFRQEPPEA